MRHKQGNSVCKPHLTYLRLDEQNSNFPKPRFGMLKKHIVRSEAQRIRGSVEAIPDKYTERLDERFANLRNVLSEEIKHGTSR